MNINLFPSSGISSEAFLEITGSKSESNRLLILQALYPEITIENRSNSDDSEVLKNALQSKEEIIDIGHAGTAMRFLTAYFAAKEGKEVILTGSKRMQERPVGILVEALKDLGAEIDYQEKEGFPPLKIKGKKLIKDTVKINPGVSSQFITALCLIAPFLPNGLTIHLTGEITSASYLQMTFSLLEKLGVVFHFQGNRIEIQALEKPKTLHFTVESDWSSASYFYGLMALSKGGNISLKHFSENSLQGDRNLVEIFEEFGVRTEFDEKEKTISLIKKKRELPKRFSMDLNNNPDLAQTLAVTCLGLGIECDLTGLETLKIKETDRLAALKNELEKFGAKVETTESSLKMIPSENLLEFVSVQTYDDHRMAMAFSILGIKIPLTIEDGEVVSKSYPGFWEDLRGIGVKTEKV